MSTLTQSFSHRAALFRLQPFRWYIINAVTAMLGNGLVYIAMTWLVLRGHNSVASVAILMACFWLPTVFLGPFCGVLADRMNRKNLMLASNLLRMVSLFIFWYLLKGTPSILSIYCLSFINGFALVLYLPAAMAFMREIVPENLLMHANATIDMGYELGGLLGMGFAGLIIAATSMRYTFLINALTFLVASFSLYKIKHVSQINVDHQTGIIQTAMTDLRAGFSYLKEKVSLRAIYYVQMLLFVCFMTAPVLLAPYAKNFLHVSVGQFGMIEMSLSIGSVIGNLVAPSLAEIFSVRKVIITDLILVGVCFAMFSHIHVLWVNKLLYFLIGIGFSAWPLVMTGAQNQTKLAFQGRVQSFFLSISGIIIMLVYCGLYTSSGVVTVVGLYWCEAIFAIIGLFLMIRRCHFK